MITFFRLTCAFFLWTAAAAAQTTVWIQVEAHPTLTAAQDRVRSYAAALPDVAGYYIGGGWYGIVLGPYTAPDADNLLRQLRGSGQVPDDSFIAFGNNFRQQFWPIGVGAPTSPQPLPGTSAPAEASVAVQEVLPDETPAQARASEGLLTREEREELQIALRWAGTYTGAIDGAFGRGTRGAMQQWQTDAGYTPTGILTTAQRAELLGAYNGVLEGLDLQLVRDDAAGIELLIPMNVVEFSAYEPPFARYDAKGDLPARVLLISQPGDETRMAGLYEILQTLAVVPPDGERARQRDGFSIIGTSDTLTSRTQVVLRDGQIKGVMLVWPPGDTARFDRVWDEIWGSFTTFGGTLDPAIAQPDDAQAIDMIAGLAVRKPKLSRSGFFINGAGDVLTTTDVIAGCERMTIDIDHDARVQHRDDALGIAVLRPAERLAPIASAAFQTAVPRLQSGVAVAGFPYGGLLVRPTLTFGRLADLRGLNGEDALRRLELTSTEGDAGGPVYDNGGAVLGMLKSRDSADGRILPSTVSFAVDAEDIIASLTAANVAVETTDTAAFMPPETLTLRAADQTVLVSCW